jgi:hypothetical protein
MVLEVTFGVVVVCLVGVAVTLELRCDKEPDVADEL